MWGIEGIEPVIEITVPLARRPRVKGAVIHRTDGLLLPERTRLRDVPITTPPRTVFDLSAVLPRGTMDRVVEDVLSRRIAPRRALADQLDQHGGRGRRGTSVLGDLLAAHPDRWERAEGRFERRLLRYLKARGHPEPVLQYKVQLPNRRFATIDFAYPPLLVALEADSYLWHTARRDWARNQTRNRMLTAMGWRIIPVTWEDIVRRDTGFEEALSTVLWTSTRA
jgi:very-short-patch-repair endonuclease